MSKVEGYAHPVLIAVQKSQLSEEIDNSRAHVITAWHHFHILLGIWVRRAKRASRITNEIRILGNFEDPLAVLVIQKRELLEARVQVEAETHLVREHILKTETLFQLLVTELTNGFRNRQQIFMGYGKIPARSTSIATVTVTCLRNDHWTRWFH